MTVFVSRKAELLVEAGRVRALPEAEVFVVDGESDNYLVVLAGYRWLCGCVFPGRCSHVAAAQLHAAARLLRDRDEREAAA